jgi:hypothetical protein
MGERRTLNAALLDGGYPVLISNRSDFLSPPAYEDARRGIGLLTEMGVKAAFQTKGGTRERLEEIEGTLDYKAVWYYTLTTMDDGYCMELERGAPPTSERLRQIGWLTGRGHKVYVGFNPYERSFHMGRTGELVGAAADAGAFGALLQCLHLNSNQKKRMSGRELEVVGAETVDRAMRKSMDAEDLDFAFGLMGLCREKGLDVLSMFSDGPARLFDVYREVYGKVFPTNQDAANMLCDAGEDDAFAISFDDYYGAMTALEGFPEWGGDMRDYVACLNKEVLYSQAISTRGIGFRGVLRHMWEDVRLKAGPMMRRCFAMLCYPDMESVRDESGQALYLFRKSGNLPPVVLIDDLERVLEGGDGLDVKR